MDDYEPVSVFLDTTALRNDPLRRSPEFGLIKRLAELERLHLHISEVTSREFVTSRELEFDQCVIELKSKLGGLTRMLPDKNLLSALEAEFSAMNDKRNLFNDEFTTWLSEANATIHPIAEGHGKLAISKYFEGALPFQKIKARNDFPDAFIFQSLSDLFKETPGLHFVTGDKRLANAAASTFNGLKTHESVKDFVENASLQTLLNRTLNLQAVLARIKLDATKKESYLEDAILEGLVDSECSPMDEEHEFRVTGYGSLDDSCIDTDNAEDYGDGIFYMPFSATSECMYEYFIPKSDWHSLDPDENHGSASDWNDHVYHVEQERKLYFSGTLEFQLDQEALNTADAGESNIANLAKTASVTVEIEEVLFADESCQADA